ncbi:MAG: hypothetical protein LBC64_01960 [Fibromonadaceae bacterium]|jgi:uncharacterized protein (TIGR02145 family)|nr:hypothetical protein [Fibromonadaceae bacterium]
MKSRGNILKDAVETRNAIKIKYNGGSEPGKVIDIIPKKILNREQIICLDAFSKIEKIFFIDKIEIEGMAPVETKINSKKTEILLNAEKTGETLRIKWYKNDSKMGTIYNVKDIHIYGTKVIGEADNRKLRAHDLKANRTQTFNVADIKIPEDWEPEDDIPFDKSMLPKGNIIELDSFIDKRDGKKYKTFKFSYADEDTLKVKTDIWMAENLAYNAKGSRCYNDNPDNEEKYGRLYNWETAKNSCPAGWRLPSEEDWNRLIKYAVTLEANGILEIKHYEYAGLQLKSKEGWSDFFGKPIGNGADAVGFNALPGGMASVRNPNVLYVLDSKDCENLNGCGYWWISEKSKSTKKEIIDPEEEIVKNDERNMPCCYMDYLKDKIIISYFRKSHLLSVRCIKIEDKI